MNPNYLAALALMLAFVIFGNWMSHHVAIISVSEPNIVVTALKNTHQEQIIVPKKSDMVMDDPSPF